MMSHADNQTTRLDPLQREAAAWVRRLTSGKATAADADAVKRWCEQSAAHAEAYADAAHFWKAAGPAARGLRSRGDISAGLAPRSSRPAMANRRAFLGGGLAAACAAAYAAINPPLGLWPSFTELAADYRTAKGEQRQLALESKVSVNLNTQTSIALRASSGKADRIELVSGEASFATAPQAQRVLEVVAADGRTFANAARFDIRREGAEVCVSCLEGGARVEWQAEAAMLKAGQQVRYNGNGIGPVLAFDKETVAAWKQGVLIFRLTPLSEVVEEINRYRPGRVMVLDAALAQKPVSGRFHIKHMDEILLRLQQAFGVESQALPGGVVLLS